MAITERQCKMGGLGWGDCDAPGCTNPQRTRTVTDWVETTNNNDSTNEGSI